MKKSKILLAIFFIILLPIVFLCGCQDEKQEEFTVRLSSDDEYLEKIDYLISDKEEMSYTLSDNPDIHSYKKNEEIHFKLKISDTYNYYSIDEEALNNYVTATSATDSPLEIEWNKIAKNHYVGIIILTEDIVFNISGDITVKDAWHIYTLGDTDQYDFKLSDGENKSESKALTDTPDYVKFDIDYGYVKIVLEQNLENPTETPQKIYYIYLSGQPTALDKDYFINSENVSESEFVYFPEVDCYESGYIHLPEDESLLGKDMYLAIFVAKNAD